MKNIFFFCAIILTGFFTKAQQSALTGNTWILQKMIHSNTETTTPNNAEVSSINAIFGEKSMSTGVVNQFGAWTFPGPHIAITETTMIYDEYGYTTNPCTIPENCAFENDYFSFFKGGMVGLPIYYAISAEGNSLKLILTDTTGDQAVYFAQNLVVNEAANGAFKIHPNPVVDMLHIATQFSRLKIQLFDMAGNLAIATTTENKHGSFELDMKNRVSGNYMLIVKDLQDKVLYSTKIIKK